MLGIRDQNWNVLDVLVETPQMLVEQLARDLGRVQHDSGSRHNEITGTTIPKSCEPNVTINREDVPIIPESFMLDPKRNVLCN